ncbi:MAG: O-antigen ligase family protein [Caldilineales bacterium]|nr:O-antigen ligase family protein [Caldilineales bacterium]
MRRLILLSALLLLLLALTGANLLLARRTAPPPLPVAPVAGHGQLMASLDLAGLNPKQAADIVGWMAEDGMKWVRLRLPWNEIEPEAGRTDWELLQAAIDAARAHDLRIVLLLDGAPNWAVKPEDAGNPLAPPRDVTDFGRFAEAVAGGYRDAVDIYQIWDEPNIQPHWGRGWVNPQGYFDLLREAANSIQRADPDAQIMLAQLAPTTANDTLNLPDTVFLDRLYELGAAEYFDLAAAAAYGFEQPPTADPGLDRLNFRRPELLRQVMERHDDAATPLWITAWGWWTPPARNSEADSPWGGIDPALLLGYQTDGLHLAQTQWPWAGPLAWADYYLTPTHDPRRAGFVQRAATGQPTAEGATLRGLAAAPIPLGTGNHPAGNPDTQTVTGIWRTGPNAIDPNPPGGASVQYEFEGRAVAVEIQRGPYWATLKAWIDGQPAPLLPRDEAGDAYIALNDPANAVTVVPLARDLPPGPHSLRLQASAGWGQWFLRRLIIDHAPWPRPYPFWPLTAALALALIVNGWYWLHAARSPAGREAVGRVQAGWESAIAVAARWPPSLHFPLAVALLAAFAFAPSLWLSLILLLILVVVLALRPSLAPALALVALPFFMRPKPLGPIGIPVHELLVWLGFGLWLLRRLLARLASPATVFPSVSASLRRLDLPVLIFLFVAIFAALAAERRGVAFYDLRTVILTPIAFYWLVSRSELDLPRLTDGLVLGALLVSGIGLYQFLGGQAPTAEGVPRILALYGSANNLALYLGRVLPLLVAGGIIGAGLRRWLYLLALVPIAAAAFLTFSKGLLLISFPAGLLILAIFEKRLRWPILVLALLAALALLPFLGAERFAGLFDTQSGTTFFRLQLWQSAWRMFLDHPWLGVGPDNFLYTYRSHYVLPSAWQELNLSHPHNLFLDLLTRLGLFGFVTGLWLLAASLLSALRLLAASSLPLSLRPSVSASLRPSVSASLRPSLPASLRPPVSASLPLSLRPLYLGLIAGLIAGLLHGLIDNSIFLVDLSLLTFLVVGVTRGVGDGEASRQVDR